MVYIIPCIGTYFSNFFIRHVFCKSIFNSFYVSGVFPQCIFHLVAQGFHMDVLYESFIDFLFPRNRFFHQRGDFGNNFIFYVLSSLYGIPFGYKLSNSLSKAAASLLMLSKPTHSLDIFSSDKFNKWISSR